MKAHAKWVATWALSVCMPIAVLVGPHVLMHGMTADVALLPTWSMALGYAAFWAAQALLWKLDARPVDAWLLTAAAAVACMHGHPAPPVRFAQQWVPFIALANGVALAWTYYFYTRASRAGGGIADWYSGIDLHPYVCGVDIKLFIAARIGLMGWGLACLAALFTWAPGTVPVSTWVAVALQLAYITRFFTWEAAYVHTMDQQHDRCGFYITWGCQVFLPALYWLAAVQASADGARLGPGLGTWPSLACGVMGALSLWAVHEIDDQKIRVRADPQNARVHGKRATYIRTLSGSLLLTCGAWRLARHLHYLFEIGCALAWTAPVAGARWYGYAYPLYLTVLLINRTYRDDERCLKKYGSDWRAYTNLVPYRIVPFVY